ncbi:threonine/serine dehydratase [Nakamurella sp. PAMC28650]|uniref:threonine ammonia-lyase n=1 Tax=Nakamurella sp. PAMC28650 TaxID=2762325 RepID=UPI00164E6759|nr:threonine/serine dehydratase [Nakamurella sp. PAMC28650]QNK81383.1 threonine/serine dehydratase [Nakamurella sp. PAMC28650]
MQLVSIDEITDAATRIAGVAVRTPLLASPWPGLWLKPEGLQPIGAFKIRGAMTAMSRLAPDVRSRGVIAHSSGNHAQAVAYAARMFGVDAHIVIPENAPARKIEATRALGATVELVPVERRFSRPAELVAETGKAMIAPFDDRNVISGQGTIGLEIAADFTGPLTTVLVPISGGGLISGIAAALAALRPDVKVIGVEPELAGDAADSFRSGERKAWAPADTARTIADGLRTFSVGELPWEHIRNQVHDIITVSEDEIIDATRRLAFEARLVAEPSGAVPVAAWLHHRSRLPDGNAVAVVSGGNIDPDVFRMVLGA